VLRHRDRVAADLARYDVLSGAGQADLESLAGLLTPFAAPAGTVVLRRGEIADRFLLVTGGSARVVFGQEAAHNAAVVTEGPIVGEMALLRGTRRSATVSAQTDMRGLMGGRAAFARLLAIPGVLDKVVTKARQRLAADMIPVPVTLRDGATVGLRPIYPGDRRWLMKGQEQELVSSTTLYDRFFTAGPVTPAVARYLTEVDYVDHFAWVAVDRAEVSVAGASYVRSASDAALADISFLIMDEFQERGLGTLLMGAVAIAARRNGIARFSADILAENTAMRAILNHAGITWEPTQMGIVHGILEVPDPGKFGVMPSTAAALGDLVDSCHAMGGQLQAWPVDHGRPELSGP
jgi:protein lysine acetyltransferase